MTDETQLRWILESSKDLHTDQYKELFKIILDYKEKFTENSNGIFIDLEKISNNCISKIIQYLKYNQENKACLSGVREENIPDLFNPEQNNEEPICYNGMMFKDDVKDFEKEDDSEKEFFENEYSNMDDKDLDIVSDEEDVDDDNYFNEDD